MTIQNLKIESSPALTWPRHKLAGVPGKIIKQGIDPIDYTPQSELKQ